MKLHLTSKARSQALLCYGKRIELRKSITMKAKGFTIVELLVSMTITLVIVGLLLGMTKIAVEAWQGTNQKAKSSRLAKEVFDTVGRDLEGIVVRSGNRFEWVSVSDGGLSGGELGPDGGGENIANTLDVNFFSATPDRYDGQIGTSADAGGDVSLVRYRLVYQDVIDSASSIRPVYSLYRQRIEPDETFEELLGKEDLGDILSSRGSEITSEQNLLAQNIYDFTVTFTFEYTTDEDTGSKGYRRVVMRSDGDNSISDLAIKGNEILVGDQALSEEITSPRLYSADISVFVISDGGMKSARLGNFTGSWSDFLKKNGNLYTKSVILPQP